MRILSVDDDPVFLQVIKSELNDLGYTDVHQVSSGAAALELVRSSEQEFDCCLLDIDMPGMTGVELCAKLREEPRTQDKPIIMVTSRAEMESVDRAFSVGATDYLNKPLNKRELRGRLKSTEALTIERAKKAANIAAGYGDAKFDVQEAILLETSSGCIDYVAMQNFILKLGSMQMFNRVTLGIHIQNFQDIYVSNSADAIRDILTDVAEMIVDALGSRPKVMSYAGSGDFVVILSRIPNVDSDEIASNMSLSLGMLGDWYSSFGDITPTINIGDPVSRTFLSFVAPDEVLDQAIESARASQNQISYRPEGVMRTTGSKQKALSWKF
jgi:CheY-like chemotaxis protein